jgi:hypothetical protein
MESDFALTLRGNISPVTTLFNEKDVSKSRTDYWRFGPTYQAVGPQLAAKKKMKMQIKAMAAFCAGSLLTMIAPAAFWLVVVVPRMATRN